MRLRICMLSAFALSAAMFFGAAASAADLPKEGTFSGTHYGFGTFKGTPSGKERLLSVFDGNGLWATNGFLDHATTHCLGLGDYTNGVGRNHGYCVETDLAGDQVVLDFAADQKLDQKSFGGSFTLTSGTGKYAGITGSGTYVEHGPEFRMATEGTFVIDATFQGSYKLP